jgi:hypothetical protein
VQRQNPWQFGGIFVGRGFSHDIGSAEPERL